MAFWYCFVDTEDVSAAEIVIEVVSVSQSWNVRVACGLTGFDVENVYCCTQSRKMLACQHTVVCCCTLTFVG